MITIQIKGLHETRRLFRNLSEDLPKVPKKAGREFMENVIDDTKQNIMWGINGPPHVANGNLLGNITLEETDTELVMKAPFYLSLLETEHKVGLIPLRAWVTKKGIGAKAQMGIYNRLIKGIMPKSRSLGKPFLTIAHPVFTRAWDKNISELGEIIIKHLDGTIKKVSI